MVSAVKSRPASGPRASDMRGEILRAATRLFAERGFDGTALQDIAEAVGVRKPSLLYHFASKEELHQRVLDEVLARWNDSLPRILLAATAGEAQFEGVTREIVTFFNADPDRARLLIREALDRPAEMRARLAKHVQPVIVNLAGYVKRGQRAGDLRSDVDPEGYLFHTVVLLLCGVAFGDSLSGLMPRKSEFGAPKGRLTRELLRMAKASLFRLADGEEENKKAVSDDELHER